MMKTQPKTLDDIGRLLLEVWSTTKLLVDEVHCLRGDVHKIRCEISTIKRSRPPTGPVRPPLPNLIKDGCGG